MCGFGGCAGRRGDAVEEKDDLRYPIPIDQRLLSGIVTMRRWMILAPVLLAMAGTAHAQAERPFNPYDPPIVPEPSDMRPMGAVLGVYDAPEGSEPDPPQARCGRAIGCVVFINTSENYDVIAIHVDLRAPGDARGPRWDTDLLRGSRLNPRRSMFTFRSGDSTMCNQQVRAVVQNRRTRERLEGVLGTVNLCDDATHQNIMVPVRVIQGIVTLEPGE